MIVHSSMKSSHQPRNTDTHNLSAILDAYESGIGHGLQGDGHKDGPYTMRTCSVAYGVGYDEGLERAALAKQTAVAVPSVELMQELETLRDEFVRYQDGDPKVPFTTIRAQIIATLEALAAQPKGDTA